MNKVKKKPIIGVKACLKLEKLHICTLRNPSFLQPKHLLMILGVFWEGGAFTEVSLYFWNPDNRGNCWLTIKEAGGEAHTSAKACSCIVATWANSWDKQGPPEPKQGSGLRGNWQALRGLKIIPSHTQLRNETTSSSAGECNSRAVGNSLWKNKNKRWRFSSYS